ncbi:MAG TPA: carboxypeptidase-like regulatory domain-containing protein [Blastocatellia bacterium]|nr:carboxypeptidase-like regulatory domain-containing protein [Blastocatellia bacterium]
MQAMNRTRFGLAAVCLVILFASTITLAQTQTTGAIQGVVYEAGSKAPIAGAAIDVANEETGLVRTTITNNDGLYFVGMLPPGLYTVGARRDGYENDPQSSTSNFPIRLSKTNLVQPPPIVLRKIGSAPAATAAPASATTGSSAANDSEFERQVNTVNATRGGNFDRRQLTTLPLAGIRTFESLAFLLPGVAPPPQPVGGTVGPGLGAGFGTPGQFSVNGLRARSNNFTVDGSDNNDEDVGVRRQGFVALVPQSIESVQEFQMSTQLWDAGMGRNSGSQVNAVSRSGGSQVHGTVYDFFNHDALNARRFFDYASDKSQSYPLTARATAVDGTTQIVPVNVDGVNLVQPNPSEGRDPFNRHQGGVALGWPLSKQLFGPLAPEGQPKTFFFTSFEYQRVRAKQETHFSVPTVAERGLFGTGATGYQAKRPDGFMFPTNPTTAQGDSIFSLFPFPDNPVGPYGENTYTRVLPADADGRVFSFRFDHDFRTPGQVAHTLTGRYNFTKDERVVPAVGGAIASSVEPQITTHNLSLLLSSQLSPRISNQFRASYGRTQLRFEIPDDPQAVPSRLLPGTPSLLNAPILYNESFPVGLPDFVARYRTVSPLVKTADVETTLGTTGQVIVSPFSPVGLDPFLFPQGRTSNTAQYADTLTMLRGRHVFKLGTDTRRVQLNSFLDRNYRSQIVFAGAPDVRKFVDPSFKSGIIPPTGYFTGTDLASLGSPTGSFQALATGVADSTIGLRFWQFNHFFNDNWRVRRGLTLDYGLRYEYNTVPREVNNRIERTFAGNTLPAVDPSIPGFTFTSQNSGLPPVTLAVFDTPTLVRSLNQSLDALQKITGGRRTIYEPDRNNFAPHLGFAWDPFAGSGTQAGRTVIRGGFGLSYDVTLGSVVSQSRNVFPTFVPVNVDASNPLYRLFTLTAEGFKGTPCGPAPFPACFAQNVSGFVRVTFPGGNQSLPLIRPDSLNVIGVPPGLVQPILSALLQPPVLTVDKPGPAQLLQSGGGIAFTLPDRGLRTPYAMQFNLQFERELFRDFLFNISWVGSRGLKLTRFRTPNGGLNSITLPGIGGDVQQYSIDNISLPPLSNLSSNVLSRPNPLLGAYTIFDSSASSIYHSLQTGVTKRFSHGWQMTAAYTWSHAIDDVSDVFDLAGAYNLPQDDRDLRAERGDANFDIRHRFAWSMISNVPFLGRFNNASGAKGAILGGWQMASISTYQTGQPFTVNTSFDVNLDGNLTDRINTLSGLTVVDDRQQRLALTAQPTSLLAPTGRNGSVGRNTFRAAGIANTDFTLIKNFRLREGQSLVLRTEVFNLWNRTHFGAPVRILEAPSFGKSTDTVLTPRQIQFALKYVF